MVPRNGGRTDGDGGVSYYSGHLAPAVVAAHQTGTSRILFAPVFNRFTPSMLVERESGRYTLGIRSSSCNKANSSVIFTYLT